MLLTLETSGVVYMLSLLVVSLPVSFEPLKYNLLFTDCRIRFEEETSVFSSFILSKKLHCLGILLYYINQNIIIHPFHLLLLKY